MGASKSIMRRSLVRALLLTLCVGLATTLLPPATRAQEMEVPLNTQISLLTRILDFDRRLPSRTGEEVVVGIVYQSRYRASYTAYRGAVRALETQPRSGGATRVRAVAIELVETSDLASTLRRAGVDVVYIAPLRGVDRGRVTRIVLDAGALSFSGAPELRDEGVAVYFGMRGGRPRLRIDLNTARAAGADFSSELLRLADVVGGPDRG
jgi:hypothetical protein